MSDIQIGNDIISDVYIGDIKISSIYKGSDLIYTDSDGKGD